MPLINLIQEEKLAQKRVERQTRVYFFGFVGSAIASAGAFGFLLFLTESLRGEEGRLKEQAQKAAPLLKAIAENQSAYSEYAPRLKTLLDAQAMTNRWDRILTHLTVNTPVDTWLTGMRCVQSDPTKPVEIDFVGLSVAQERVGEYMLRLQNCSDLESVTLKFTQEKVTQDGHGIEFDIGSQVAGTAKEKKVAEEGKEGQSA